MTYFCEGLPNLKVCGKDPHIAHARNVHHEGSVLGFARSSYEQNFSTNELGNSSKLVPRLDLLRERRQDFKAQRRLWSTVEDLGAVVTIGSSQFAPVASKLTHVLAAIRFGYLHKELVDRKITTGRSNHQIARFEGWSCIQPFQQFVCIALNLRLCRFPSAGKSPTSTASLLMVSCSTCSIRIAIVRTHSQNDFSVIRFKPLHEVVPGLPPRVIRSNRQLAIVEVSCSEAGTSTGHRGLSVVTRLLAFGADEIMTKRLNLVCGQKREFHGNVLLTCNGVEREIHTLPRCASFYSTFTILKRPSGLMQSDYPYPQHASTFAPEPTPSFRVTVA